MFYRENDIEEILLRCHELLDNLGGRTILMSGSQGFLGRYFTQIFERYNESCSNKIGFIGLDNFITSRAFEKPDTKDSGFDFYNRDLTKPDALDGLPEKVDFIVHAAGIASPYYYRAKPLETMDVAISGARLLLEYAKKQNSKFLFFSSSEIYGDPDPDQVPIKESYRGNVASLGPRACYDESKRLGETLCYIYNQYDNVHTNIIRPFNVFGPGMQEIDYRVMPNFASRIKSNSPLTVYGDGSQTRTYCYITDAMVGFLSVLVNGVSGEPYNIGNPRPEVSVNELADIMVKSVNTKSKIITCDYPDSYPADEPMRRCPDITKAKLQLGYAPQVGLQDGVKRFLEWTNNEYVGADQID